MEVPEIRLVLTTAPDAAVGDRLARALVEEGLAACVTRLPGASSCYRWKGEVRVDTEEVLLIKTVEGRLAAAEQRVRALHTYEAPEWVVLSVAGGAADYLDWVRAETAPPPRPDDDQRAPA
jgi:periplasmic divalent cation tolerance protein